MDVKLKGWQGGQSLLEMVVVLGLAVTMVVVVVAVVMAGVKTDRISRSRTEATGLAEEEIAFLEVVRNGMDRSEFLLSDTGLNAVWCDDTEGCYIDGQSWNKVVGDQELVVSEGVSFYRSYITQRPHADCRGDSVGVEARVDWQEPSGEKRVIIWRCLAPPAEYR